ncbi:nitroreductase family protein [Actinomadura vinacea]|uniref:Nitroreductase family protein n=1 Tax=Actinomadura vinacea TaxID=115336 RepID=A0ABN3KKT3_9ACTN
MKPDALRELEPDFWRAPSAHNTQPWLLRYLDDAVEIGWDPARTLPVGDPSGRDLRLALGAFTETCLIVCADAGLRVDFRQAHSEADRRAGYLAGAEGLYTTPFTTQDVRDRRTGRGAYEPGHLDEAVLGRLENLAADEKAEVRRVPSRDLIELAFEGDHHQFSTPRIARELREWLRLDPADPRYEQDGLTDRALGLSGLETRALRAALSPRGYPVLRRLGVPKLLASASRKTLDYDGDVVVLVGRPGCTDGEQVALGRVLMRQWLTLSTLGYTTHPVSQIIDAEITKQRLARMLDIDDPSRLLNITRVGRPKATPPRSARLR